jgi:hypothetical protein
MHTDTAPESGASSRRARSIGRNPSRAILTEPAESMRFGGPCTSSPRWRKGNGGFVAFVWPIRCAGGEACQKISATQQRRLPPAFSTSASLARRDRARVLSLARENVFRARSRSTACFRARPDAAAQMNSNRRCFLIFQPSPARSTRKTARAPWYSGITRIAIRASVPDPE